MKIIKITCAAVGFLIALSACSGGGSRRILGEQCPANFDPIPLKVNANQHILSLDANQREIPPGVYKYTSGQLYYVDKSDLRLRVSDTLKKDGKTFVSNITCVRNGRHALSAPIAVEGVFKLDVDGAPEFKSVAEVKEFTLNIEHDRFTAKTQADSGKTVNSPSDIYREKASEYFMVATDGNEVDYEIRSHLKDDKGEYFLSILLKREKK